MIYFVTSMIVGIQVERWMLDDDLMLLIVDVVERC